MKSNLVQYQPKLVTILGSILDYNCFCTFSMMSQGVFQVMFMSSRNPAENHPASVSLSCVLSSCKELCFAVLSLSRRVWREGRRELYVHVITINAERR